MSGEQLQEQVRVLIEKALHEQIRGGDLWAVTHYAAGDILKLIAAAGVGGTDGR